MKMQQATALIARALLQKEVSNQPKDLSELVKIPIIQVHNVLNKMGKDGLITITEDESGKTYSVRKTDEIQKLAQEEVPEQPEEPETEKKKPVAKEKHTGKFVFNKVALSKSQCALQIVTQYFEKQQPTLRQLKETFPDKIVSQFGIVKTLKEAKGLSELRSRYHLKDHQILTTSDDHKVAVTNQWTQDRFQQLLEIAKTLGYKVTPE